MLFCYKIKPKTPLYFSIKSRIFSRHIESPRYGGPSLSSALPGWTHRPCGPCLRLSSLSISLVAFVVGVLRTLARQQSALLSDHAELGGHLVLDERETHGQRRHAEQHVHTDGDQLVLVTDSLHRRTEQRCQLPRQLLIKKNSPVRLVMTVLHTVGYCDSLPRIVTLQSVLEVTFLFKTL